MTAKSLIPTAEKQKGADRRPRVSTRLAERLLDLALAELDVLLRSGIVFLLHQLLGLRARVLLGDIVEAGVGARHELDFDGRGLGHGICPREGRNFAGT